MSWDETRELLSSIGLPMILGASGFVVRVCRFGFSSWRQFVASAVTSMFTSVLVYWTLDLVTLPATVVAAIVGFSGYLGGMLLDAAQGRAIHTVKNEGLPIDTPRDKD